MRLSIPRHYRKQYRRQSARQEPKYELLRPLGPYDIGCETFARDVTPKDDAVPAPDKWDGGVFALSQHESE